MNTKQSSTVASCKVLVAALLAKLQEHGDLTHDQLWRLYSDRESSPSIMSERELLAKLILELQSANPRMLSKQLILDKVLYGIVGRALEVPMLSEEALGRLGQTLEDLVTYCAERLIDVPLINLAVGAVPYAIGKVTFRQVDAEISSDPNWALILASSGVTAHEYQIVSYAQVVAPGDLDTSTRYARETVDELLLIIRGIGFPIQERDVPQLGVINEFSLSSSRPFRLHPPEESTRLEFPSPMVTHLGPAIRPYDLREELLSRTEPASLQALIRLIDSEGIPATGRAPSRVLSGLRWIGEASKPDVLSARYSKLAFALETVIGGESNQETLSTRGITATLAERAAFLVGNTPQQRENIDQRVRQFYGKRSGIVHGGAQAISDNDLRDFSALARSVVWAFLGKIDQFGSVEALQRWVIQQRYS